MTSNENGKFPACLKAVGSEIKETILSKRIGCFVGLVAWLLTVIHTIVYAGISEEIFNVAILAFSVIGLVLFLVLSLFRQTSGLAPIALMICDFMSLVCFIGTDGIIDYFSTQFFNGFSFAKVFELPFAVWFSVLSFLLSFVIASAAMYLPQNKKSKAALTDETVREISQGEV